MGKFILDFVIMHLFIDVIRQVIMKKPLSFSSAISLFPIISSTMGYVFGICKAHNSIGIVGMVVNILFSMGEVDLPPGRAPRGQHTSQFSQDSSMKTLVVSQDRIYKAL